MLSLYQAGWRGCSLPIRRRDWLQDEMVVGRQEQMFDGGVGWGWVVLALWLMQLRWGRTILRMRPCEGRLNVNPRTFTGVNFKLLLFVLIPTDFSLQRNISPTKMVVARVFSAAMQPIAYGTRYGKHRT